ncbi:uncharacterized protein LOC134175698 [Pezoporus occidentalis]|uniref:uncharacterized protein LOC134175698 n=1 Tax=Pezoporus occidentalis TaxID=407982 RepID=UPI002F90F2CC
MREQNAACPGHLNDRTWPRTRRGSARIVCARGHRDPRCPAPPPTRRPQPPPPAPTTALLGVPPARLRPSPVAPQRQRGHACAGAAESGAALPNGGAVRAARTGSAARCRRARCLPGATGCWQAVALLNPRAVIAREGLPPQGAAAPRCGHPTPLPPRPPPRLSRVQERRSDPHLRPKPWELNGNCSLGAVIAMKLQTSLPPVGQKLFNFHAAERQACLRSCGPNTVPIEFYLFIYAHTHTQTPGRCWAAGAWKSRDCALNFTHLAAAVPKPFPLSSPASLLLGLRNLLFKVDLKGKAETSLCIVWRERGQVAGGGEWERHICTRDRKGYRRSEKDGPTDCGGTDFTAEFARCELFVNVPSRLRSSAAPHRTAPHRTAPAGAGRGGRSPPEPSRAPARSQPRALARPRQPPGSLGSPAPRAHDPCREFSLPAPAGSCTSLLLLCSGFAF